MGQEMKIFKVKDFKGGWILGNFEPTLFKTSDFEVAIHSYKKGYKSDHHYHKIGTEYNVVLSGECEVRDEMEIYTKMRPGDGWIYRPGEKSDVKFTKKTKLLIVKTPSIPSDKYYDN
jgi:quercetin dioxygenase-like cupin family protein